MITRATSITLIARVLHSSVNLVVSATDGWFVVSIKIVSVTYIIYLKGVQLFSKLIGPILILNYCKGYPIRNLYFL